MSQRLASIGLVALGAVAVAITGCAAVVPISSRPSPQERDGTATPIDAVSIADGGHSIHVDFVGGKEFAPDDPCSVAYEAEAQVAGETLEIGVFPLRHPIALPPHHACEMIGYSRELDVKLDQPFRGTRVWDRSGQLLLLEAPLGLVTINALPDGWLLRREESLASSPTGRWSRTYSPIEDPDHGDSWVQLIQAFGADADVTGGNKQPDVEITGVRATYYLHTPSGEMVLVWRIGADGVALVGNLQDFTEEQFLQLAASVEPAS